ncbi:MAG: hypothetical protein Q8868_10660 [Bacteroidota bacterium]|nr:hypothetical protein [Bacteroidota bacterium]
MKNFLFAVWTLLLINGNLAAQEKEIILVKAGTNILDYFPFKERYQFPEFRDGKVKFKNGLTSSGRFNYNILTGEMDFVQAQDTMAFSNKKDISYVTVAMDTFFYSNGYVDLISHGHVKIGMKQRILLKEIERKGAYGMTDRNSAIDTYNLVEAGGNFYKLTPNEDWVLGRSKQFYIKDSQGEFILLNKKYLFDLFPLKRDSIKEYLKSNKVDFRSEDDMRKLGDYLDNL